MSAPAPVEIPEPSYRYYATPRESGPCAGGCGDVILPGELMAKYRDEIRCKRCAERWVF